MQIENLNISNLLREFQGFLCGYLSEFFPKICTGNDDWWKIMIKSARLRGSQKNQILSGAISKIEDLDIVSLSSALSYHWPSIIRFCKIQDPHYQGRLLCDSIINLRNRIHHEGTGNRLEPEEELRGVLDLSKLCGLLSAPKTLFDELEKEKRRLLDCLSQDSLTSAEIIEDEPVEKSVIEGSLKDETAERHDNQGEEEAESSTFDKKQQRRLLELRDIIAGVQSESDQEDSGGSKASRSRIHQRKGEPDAFDFDFALNLLSTQADPLGEIEDALQRLELGTYGICEESGTKIPLARLEAIPFARLTVECQTAKDEEESR